MATVMLGVEEWARQQFGDCRLGDARRTERLVTVAAQAAACPDASTPNQSETWGDCRAAYRLFNEPDVTFDAIIAPHCELTRTSCEPDSVKLIINDTTELDFGIHRDIDGVGPTGNGYGRGFFLHTALMVDAESGDVEGLAGQKLFYRKFPKPGKKPAVNARRRKGSAESQVWRNLMEKVGRPPKDVKWIHICDRGADDYEVFCQAQRQGCGFVVRAAKLNRKVLTLDGRKLPVSKFLEELPVQGTRTIVLSDQTNAPGRTVELELRFGRIKMPRPSIVTQWMRDNAPEEAFAMNVVELREKNPPKGVKKPVRWVLYTSEEAQWVVSAEKVIDYYRGRPVVEDYHKALKTGTRIEDRRYETAAALERVLGLSSVLAVRLLQIKTAAFKTPDRPASDFAPKVWIVMLQQNRKLPVDETITIAKFVRLLAQLGGHLGRKCDGRPGWITLWRGLQKLHLMVRGAELRQKKCGKD